MTEPSLKTRLWEAPDLLETEDNIAAYLDAVLDEGDPSAFVTALGYIARAKGMMRVAREAGLGRESLYKALAEDGNPAFATVHAVARALGLRFRIVAERS